MDLEAMAGVDGEGDVTGFATLVGEGLGIQLALLLGTTVLVLMTRPLELARLWVRVGGVALVSRPRIPTAPMPAFPGPEISSSSGRFRSAGSIMPPTVLMLDLAKLAFLGLVGGGRGSAAE